MKTLRGSLLVAGGVIVTLLAGTMAIAEVPAKIYLTGGTTKDVEVIGRRAGDILRVQTGDGVGGRAEFAIRSIESIVYEAGDLERKARAHYDQGSYPQAVALLKSPVDVIASVLDVPHNATRLVTLLVKAHHASGNYAACRDLCDRVLERANDPELVQQVRSYKVLSSLGTNALDDAKEAFEEMDEFMVEGDEPVPAYWFASSRLNIARERWWDAHEDIARLVALHAKNDEWMPLALYESARLHYKFGNDEISQQVARELTLIYPTSIWSEKVKRLKTDFPFPQLMNPGFEEDTFTEEPGSIEKNTAITGWNAEPPARVGLNNKQLRWTADNGVIPEGKNVLFMQAVSNESAQVSQLVDGFRPGAEYYLVFHENARAKRGTVTNLQSALLSVSLDDDIIAPDHLVRPVETAARHHLPYTEYASRPFKATKPAHRITFRVRGVTPEGPARPVLLDNIELHDWSLRDYDERDQRKEQR